MITQMLSRLIDPRPMDRAALLVAQVMQTIARALQALPADKQPAQAKQSLDELADAIKEMARAQAPIAAYSVRITGADDTPPGKRADADLIFAPSLGILGGLKLIGFAVWERRSGGGHNVTFPARQYSVNGERRSFSLLRPNSADTGSYDAQNTIRDLILDAWRRADAQRLGKGESRTYDYAIDGSPWTPTDPGPSQGPRSSSSQDTPQAAANSTETSRPADDPPISAYDDSTPGTTITAPPITVTTQIKPATSAAPLLETVSTPIPCENVITLPRAELTNRGAEELARSIATEIGPTLSPNDRRMISLGIFPAGTMETNVQRISHRDAHRLLAVALMDWIKAQTLTRGTQEHQEARQRDAATPQARRALRF